MTKLEKIANEAAKKIAYCNNEDEAEAIFEEAKKGLTEEEIEELEDMLEDGCSEGW